MSIPTINISAEQVVNILSKKESHFLDFKSKAIDPAKLTRSLSAFANADGGEIYVGIDQTDDGFRWSGFPTLEDANGHIQALERFFPLGNSYNYSFLMSENYNGLVLLINTIKTSAIMKASDGKIYLRRSAQNIPQTDHEQIRRLELNKGVTTFEDYSVDSDASIITNSAAIIGFMLEIIPLGEPEVWLRKQRLIIDAKPIVAGLLLFCDEPQVFISKANIKIYRYNMSEEVGTRETLAFDPITIEGDCYTQIYEAVAKTKEIAERTSAIGITGLERIEYPTEAIHEIITNAVIHRDYSINDDIHIRVFDNRIEVSSPGVLPGHVTPKNILDERFARNPKIVRLLNKFKNAPNKDVGEGLNTAFEAMKKLRLKEPIIEQRENSVLVLLRHERLGSAEELIVEYLKSHNEITNAIARSITYIGSENKVKNIFKKLVESRIIERIPGRSQAKAAYKRGINFDQDLMRNSSS